AKDPDNLLWWRMNRRRLEFEALRDSLLAVSGQLDLTVGGRPWTSAASRSARGAHRPEAHSGPPAAAPDRCGSVSSSD
ncbi:MAG: DUF1553 domain-containing protein, partial [Rhodospirillales bacterium]|nr:DUF1553 domain-containing protein [Rhodospirillales bacterium]